jgi:hypothetical protein
VIDPVVFFVMHIFMNIGNCLRFVVLCVLYVCVTGMMMSGQLSVLQATMSGRLTNRMHVGDDARNCERRSV